MSYLNCVGDACKRVGSAIARTAVQAVASIPTPLNYYKSAAREAIKKLSPQAFALYQEAYEKGAGAGDGRLNRDIMRRIGIFGPEYSFPEGAIDVNKAFDELKAASLIYFPGRDRDGSRINRSRLSNSPIIVQSEMMVEKARRMARNWGLRKPSASYILNNNVRQRKLNIERPVRQQLDQLELIEKVGDARQLPSDVNTVIGTMITGVEGPIAHQKNTLKRKLKYRGPLRKIGALTGNEAAHYENRYTFTPSSASSAAERTRRRRARRSPRKSRKVRKH
jgi:hypothetical protein